MTNNIFADNTLWGISMGAALTGDIDLSYNLVNGNGSGAIQNDTQTNGVTTDPLFASTTHSDFRITLGSPAIDAATDLGDTYKQDYSNRDRDVFGWDIGAYVYHACGL